MIQPSSPEHAKVLDAFKKDMLLFGRVCLPTMFTVRSPEFHKELARLFMDPSEMKLNIIAPRGHAKSSLAACLWVLYHLFFDPGPHLVVLVSKTEGHAVRLLQTLKDALNYSIPLRKYFGYHGEFVSKVWKEKEIVLDNGDMIICRGTSQQIVGLKHINQRPTLIILDDPEDMMNTKTAEAMEINLRWLLQSLVPSRDPIRGRVAIIGTPQHQRCMVEVMSGAKGWTTRRYKAIQDDGKSTLWPEWMPLSKLIKEKEDAESIGKLSSFYREYQCQIIGDEDQLFKPSDVQYFEGDISWPEGKSDLSDGPLLMITERNGQKLELPEVVPVNLFMGVDPASSQSQTADYSTIVVVAMDDKKRRYVVDYFRGRVTPLALSEKILEKYRYWKPVKTRIETTGYQEMLREHVRGQAYIPGLEIRELPRQKKSNRLEAMQPFFAQHMVYLRKSQTELLDELFMYPRGKHDDLLDGLYYAMKRNNPPYHAAPDPGRKQNADDAWEPETKDSWVTA